MFTAGSGVVGWGTGGQFKADRAGAVDRGQLQHRRTYGKRLSHGHRVFEVENKATTFRFSCGLEFFHGEVESDVCERDLGRFLDDPPKKFCPQQRFRFWWFHLSEASAGGGGLRRPLDA